ncbi:MAG: hypothetical protein JO048_08805 [Methylobacteriaceae bacterium]|nr:hypothetical protein [Methylobacteriaceae bacterium]
MSEMEIALARAYLKAADQDPVGALIRSVRDLARTQGYVSAGYVRGRLPGLLPEDGEAEDGVSADLGETAAGAEA